MGAYASGTISALNGLLVPSGSASGSYGLTVQNVSPNTLVVEGDLGDGVWQQLPLAKVTASGYGPIQSTITQDGTYSVQISHFIDVRVRASAYTSGTITVTMYGEFPVAIPAQSNANIISPLDGSGNLKVVQQGSITATVSGSVGITGTPSVNATISGTPSVNATVVGPLDGSGNLPVSVQGGGNTQGGVPTLINTVVTNQTLKTGAGIVTSVTNLAGVTLLGTVTLILDGVSFNITSILGVGAFNLPVGSGWRFSSSAKITTTGLTPPTVAVAIA